MKESFPGCASHRRIREGETPRGRQLGGTRRCPFPSRGIPVPPEQGVAWRCAPSSGSLRTVRKALCRSAADHVVEESRFWYVILARFRSTWERRKPVPSLTFLWITPVLRVKSERATRFQ